MDWILLCASLACRSNDTARGMPARFAPQKPELMYMEHAEAHAAAQRQYWLSCEVLSFNVATKPWSRLQCMTSYGSGDRHCAHEAPRKPLRGGSATSPFQVPVTERPRNHSILGDEDEDAECETKLLRTMQATCVRILAPAIQARPGHRLELCNGTVCAS